MRSPARLSHQRPDDRDRPTHGGLVGELRAHLLGGREELGPVRREERLVARHDVGAPDAIACSTRVRAGSIPPIELDDDVGADDERLPRRS